jgi:hypothetical protein
MVGLGGCTKTRYYNHISRLWREEDDTCRAQKALQAGHNIIMADRVDESGAIRQAVTTTVADYGGEQVNQKQMTGVGHKGVANGT